MGARGLLAARGQPRAADICAYGVLNSILSDLCDNLGYQWGGESLRPSVATASIVGLLAWDPVRTSMSSMI